MKKIINVLIIGLFFLNIFVVSNQFGTPNNISTENLSINNDFVDNEFENENENNFQNKVNLEVNENNLIDKFDPITSNRETENFEPKYSIQQENNLEIGESIKVDFSGVNRTQKEITQTSYQGTQLVGNFSTEKLECPATHGGAATSDCKAWIDSYDIYVYVMKYIHTSGFGDPKYLFLYEFEANGTFIRENDISSILTNWDQGIFGFSVNVNYLTFSYDEVGLSRLWYYNRDDFTYYQAISVFEPTYEINNDYYYSAYEIFAGGGWNSRLRIRNVETLALITEITMTSEIWNKEFFDIELDENYAYVSFQSVGAGWKRIYKVLISSPYTVSLLIDLDYTATHITINTENEELFAFNSSDNTIRVYETFNGEYIKQFRLNGSNFGFYQNFAGFSFVTTWNEETWFTKNLFILDFQNYDLATSWENVFIWEFEKSISTEIFNPQNLNFDDNKETLFWSRTTGLFVEFSARISLTMYDLANPDIIGIDFRFLKVLEGSSTEIFNSQYLELSGISGSYGSSEVVVNVLYGYDSAFSYVNLSFFDTGSNTEIIVGNTTTDLILTVQEMKLYVDFIYSERESFSSQIRSKYQYKDNNNFIHFLPIQNYEYRMNFTINTPTYLEFSNIEPYTPNQLIGYNYVFYDTLPVNYIIELQSGSNKGLDYPRQDQIVAISDVSDIYLDDSDFENDFNNDWINRPAVDFDSLTLNQTIVKSGVSSFKLINTGGQATLLGNGAILENGEYYLHFSFYFENSVIFPIYFYYLFNGAYTPARFDLGVIANRWYDFNLYFQITGIGSLSGIVSNILFETSNPLVLFIDEFKLYQVNTEIETKSSSETVIESQFNYWNSKGLFPAINEIVRLNLYVRSDTTLIDSYSGYTNENGILTWIWRGEFEQKEYDLRSIAWNSWFGFKSYDYWENVGYWESTDYESIDLLDNRLVLNLTTISGAKDPTLNPSGSFDLSNVDYLVFNSKSSVSITNNAFRFYTTSIDAQDYAYIDTSSSSTTFSTNWQENILDLSNPCCYSGGNYQKSSTDYIRLYITTTAYILYIDDFRFIQAQKYYFTPQTVGFTDYAERELLDAFDFSEGDIEGCNSCAYSPIALNGYLNSTNPKDWSGLWFRFGYGDSEYFDGNYYNYLKIRYRANNIYSSTSGIYFYLYDSINLKYAYKTLGVPIALNNKWSIFESDLTTWTKQDSTFDFSKIDYIYAYTTSGWDIQTNDSLNLDYLTINHKDSLDSGYDLEFEQNNYLEGFLCSYATCEVENGYLNLKQTAQYGRYYKLNIDLELSNFDYILVKMKASTTTLWYQYLSTGVFDYTNGKEINLTTEWQIFKLHISGFTEYDLYTLWGYNAQTNDNIFVEYIRFVSENPNNLFESSNSFILDNEVKTNYNIWIDNQYLGIYSSWEYIPKNLTVGTHTIRYQAFQNELERFSLPSAVYEYEYQITNSDIMKITIHDQSGKIIDFDSTKTYINNIRLYSEFVYFLDTSQTFNFTITDIFDNVLYQNVTEFFEQFKEIQITLYSTKILNIQPNPIYLFITRGSKIFSEWILPNEIVKFYFESDSYNFTIVYSDDITGGFGSAVTNTTVVSFIYVITDDTALLVTGNSIQDVFNNIIALGNNIDALNATINYNRENFTIQFSATNQNVTILINDSNFIIDTINSNFTSIQSNFTAIINALNSNFTEIYSNFTAIIDNIAELLGLFRVHFSIIDTLGIGLPFETALLTLNDTRQLDSDIYLPNNSFVRIKAYDYFDTILFEENYTINENNQNINVSMTLYEMIAFNNGSFTSYVEIYKNGKLGLNVTIPKGNAISFRLTEGLYDYKAYYFEKEDQLTNTNNPSLYDYGKRIITVGKISVSAELPSSIDISSPNLLDAIGELAEGFELSEDVKNMIWLTLGFVLSYFVQNLILRPMFGRHVKDPAYVKPEHRKDWMDSVEDRFLETDNKDYF